MSNQDFTLVLSKDQNPTGYRLTDLRLSDEAAITIDEALEKARVLTTIDNEDDLQAFIMAETELQDCMGQIVGSIRGYKDAYHKAHKFVCAKEQEVLAPLQAESTRLKAEMARIYAERRRKEEAEKRQLEELAGKARLAAIRQEDQQEAEKLNEFSGQMAAAAQTVVTPVAHLTIKLGWNIQLVDMVKVANTHPHLLRVEPNKPAINDMIKQLQDGGTTIEENTIPGIRLTPAGRVNVRR